MLRGPHINGTVGLVLHEFQQRFFDQLQYRQKRHDDSAAAFLGDEQFRERDELLAVDARQHARHALAHGKRLELHVMVGIKRSARQYVLEREQQFAQADGRQRTIIGRRRRLRTYAE